MTETITTKVLVVGGGPGGYVAAIRCGQLGLQTTLVEGDRLGGTCLIRGCIPSKALIHVADKFHGMTRTVGKGHHGISIAGAPKLNLAETVTWKESVVDKLNGGVTALLKRAQVRVVEGWGVFSDAKTCAVKTKSGDVTIKAEYVILATGSEAMPLPHIPFGDKVISSTEALSLSEVPKKLAVVGAGYIGLELGIAFAKFGSEVTVVEAQDRILPLYDKDLTKPVAQSIEKLSIKVLLGAKAQGFKAGKLSVEDKDGKKQEIAADHVLVTVGRRPRTEGWGRENMTLDMAGRFVKVDDTCRTAMKGVFAIGDLVGEPMLEHKAAAQGEMVAEVIAGHRRRFDPASIPAVCFTDPEIVTAGLSAEEATAKGIDVTTSLFPLSANGRALSMDAGEGFVRVVARKDDKRIVGIQAVGQHIAELSGEFSMAIEMAATLEDLAGIIHAHPTLSEAFFEASLRGLGHAIHI